MAAIRTRSPPLLPIIVPLLSRLDRVVPDDDEAPRDPDFDVDGVLVAMAAAMIRPINDHPAKCDSTEVLREFAGFVGHILGQCRRVFDAMVGDLQWGCIVHRGIQRVQLNAGTRNRLRSSCRFIPSPCNFGASFRNSVARRYLAGLAGYNDGKF